MTKPFIRKRLKKISMLYLGDSDARDERNGLFDCGIYIDETQTKTYSASLRLGGKLRTIDSF